MHRSIRLVIGIAASLLGLALVVGFGSAAAFTYFNSFPTDFSSGALSETEGITPENGDALYPALRFEVRRGESAQSVGQRLADSALIRSRYFWQLVCRMDKEFIKSGVYRIELPATTIAIHQILISGKQLLLRVTVPEGFTLKKTAGLMEETGICGREEFLEAAFDPAMTGRYRIPGESMEGYLYPDTYFFPSGYPAEKVVETMADTFFARIAEIDGNTASMSPDELNRLVVLASIVEREYLIGEEAPVMAGVFQNRLGIGMALQSCATVVYIITEVEGKPHPEILSAKDLEIRNPYNTYMRPGLPPGPISSPGAVALRAALFPSKSNYLYFRLVDQASGKHYFSGTLDDHIKAGKLYVKGGS